MRLGRTHPDYATAQRGRFVLKEEQGLWPNDSATEEQCFVLNQEQSGRAHCHLSARNCRKTLCGRSPWSHPQSLNLSIHDELQIPNLGTHPRSLALSIHEL
mmetsp:Transcript_40771/g.75845  ORF Transcript_40771/g.75845 Transcript_40771/m.75845 type:complete len:101 (+) Transcript_40771:32-334(+)